MDTHADHQNRATARFGALTVQDTFLCHTQLDAVDFLERCVLDLEPLTALIGDAGTGKTTALDVALTRRDRAGDRVIRARNFVAGPLSLHRALTAALGVADVGELSADQLEPALRRALARAGDASPPVLAVDNAQSLPSETLRYLSLLAGLREAGQPLFRILLVGRPGFTLRHATPVQFALRPVHPDAAIVVVRERLERARVDLDDAAMHAIVRDAHGNLRRLNTLLRARIDQAHGHGGGRLRSLGGRVATAGRRLLPSEQPSWRGTLAAAAALLAVSLASGFIAYQTGGPHRPPNRATVAAATTSLASPTPPAPPVPIPPTPSPAPAHPASQLVFAEPAPVAPSPTGPLPAVPATASQAPTPGPIAAPAPAPPTSGGNAVAAPPQATRFRVNNISGCHHGVCPRWAVTDLDRQVRFVAAFDPSLLHLDHETLQRLRQGSLDLTVSGSLRKHGQEGQTLVAETLQSVSPHRGRPRQPSVDASDSAASPDRSPPPSFLPVPSETPTVNEAPLPNPQQ